jgi:hypothetical protein
VGPFHDAFEHGCLKGDKLTEEERTATRPAGTVYTYELPFAPRDLEADFHTAIGALAAY